MFKKVLLAACAAFFLSSGVAFAAEKLNLNTASSEELQMLDGVGPATAAAIVAYRESNGDFESVDELKSVKGIGDKKLQQLSENVTVSSE